MANKKYISDTPKVLNKNAMAFAALNPYTSTNIVENVEKEISGKDFIGWGNDNQYPSYLFDLYSNCATLQSVINGTIDFIVGNESECNVTNFQIRMNKNDETLEDILQRLACDFLIYGGFAIQVIRDYNNAISEIYWVDFSKLRSDKKNEVFFYSEDWDKSFGRVKYITYPKFRTDDKNPTSIYYYKGTKTRSVYPTPLYNASVLACEMEKKINEFHLNELNNNFLSSKIINFNAGVPDDEMKAEIERNINEKFSGTDNAGRILISFNDNEEQRTTVENLGTDNFADRYNALAKRAKEEIFVAFRATPMLFGVPQENSGFNIAEYEESFKLYNRTTVRPMQKVLVNAFDKIFDFDGSVSIVPFSLEDNQEDTVEN